MASANPSTRLTYDDLVKMSPDGYRYEIIDGELLVNPAPIPRHQIVVNTLTGLLFIYFRAHGGGQAMGSPIDVVFSDDTVVQPDLIVIKPERASIIGPKNIQGAPNLCIEVLSDSTRRLDEIDKRKLYERGGVDEYWIVDPELELVKIYRRAGAAFERVAEISTETGGTITTPLLPEFALDVAEVFRT
jgi:Uma2 family endonuclease